MTARATKVLMPYNSKSTEWFNFESIAAPWGFSFRGEVCTPKAVRFGRRNALPLREEKPDDFEELLSCVGGGFCRGYRGHTLLSDSSFAVRDHSPGWRDVTWFPGRRSPGPAAIG